MLIDKNEREKWWQIWRKKKDLPDRQITYLAFIAGWNSGSKFNADSDPENLSAEEESRKHRDQMLEGTIYDTNI